MKLWHKMYKKKKKKTKYSITRSIKPCNPCIRPLTHTFDVGHIPHFKLFTRQIPTPIAYKASIRRTPFTQQTRFFGISSVSCIPSINIADPITELIPSHSVSIN